MIFTPEIIFVLLAVSKNRSDEETDLAIKIRHGDHGAFKSFFDAHFESLYRFLRSKGLSHDEAEDLIQKAFVIIWDKRDGIDETKSLRAYLFRIAYTRMLNYLSYESKFNDEGDSFTDMQGEATENELQHSELLRHIHSIVNKMPEKRGIVFQLCFMQQLTYKETAEALDVSPKTVENHMALAFKDLRSALIRIYGEEILNVL